MNILIDYSVAAECKNKDAWYTCYKCGKCGRKFNEDGIMVDDGGNTVMEDEDFE